MTELIKFDVYEKYRAEGTQRAEAVGAFHEREQKARQELSALQAEYQQKIEDSVKTGKDATKALDALDAKIAEAERLVTRRTTEYEAANNAHGNQQTTEMDVINAWLQDYAPKVKQSIMGPVNERLEMARALILSAVVDIYQANADYSDIHSEVAEVSRAAHSSGKTGFMYSLSKPIDVMEIQRFVSKFSDEIESTSRSKQLPAGVEYIEKVADVNKVENGEGQ
ncbi:hypothetical protein [Sporosarcina highlanderae]|uniref:Phage protein n=1 Tax=Sporosarcina highlanderae TaxID=3035916 RepID=A0ABT8JUA1_9BACL|nr:hypothetical protein [Sporosarcina highlanderae]MDN4608644.1 hypothetical protein [Sporosarcina highlanderae]